MTSPNGTLIVGLSGSITDANGNVWAVNANQQVTVNGLVDSTTSGVGLLGYDNGLIWQENTADRWYSKTSPSAPWSNYPQGSPSPVPLPPASANGTSITAGDGSIVDAEPADSTPQIIIYSYRIAGVGYECSQDVSMLGPFVENLRLDSAVQVRYSRDNPADSIVVAETWNGLRKTVENSSRELRTVEYS